MDFDCEDIFVSDYDYHLRSLTTDQFVIVVDEVICNENIDDCAALCFQMFYRVTADSIYKNTFDGDYRDLIIIAACVNRLRQANKFNPILFLDYILSEFVTLPLEIIWWLHKHDIVYFVQYCEVRKQWNISESLIKFIDSKREHNFFIHEQIVEDLLEELIRCSCQPRTGILRLPRSKKWMSYCSVMLTDLLDNSLKTIFENTTEPSGNFMCYLPNLSCRLPSIVMQRFFQNVLSKILLYNVNIYDIYGAYTYQPLWTSANISGNLVAIYEKMFSRYCNLDDIVTIMEEYDDKINWKYALAAVSICVKLTPTGTTDIKNKASRFLKVSFKGGKFKPFLKCLLFMRQAFTEPNMNMDYKTWYSMTFGSTSNFKTKYTATFFKFVLNVLTSLIPHEPKVYLKIQILQMLDAPVKCNSLVHDYKRLCRSRLQELEQSPTFMVDGGEVALLHLIEESIRNKNISATFGYVIKNGHICSILQELIKDALPFSTIKQMLISEHYLTEDDFNNIPTVNTKS